MSHARPWEIYHPTPHSRFAIYSDDDCVATVYEEQDAKMIVHAPDMYVALVQAQIDIHQNLCAGWPKDDPHCKACAELKDLIARIGV